VATFINFTFFFNFQVTWVFTPVTTEITSLDTENIDEILSKYLNVFKLYSHLCKEFIYKNTRKSQLSITSEELAFWLSSRLIEFYKVLEFLIFSKIS
jgi:hypothetical protein